MHARLEDDWLPHCGRFAKHNKIKCYYTDEMILDYLQNKVHVPPGTLLQVASGVPLKNFTNLCSVYKCFKVAEIVEELKHIRTGLGDCITREIFAAIEFWTASYAYAFYGNLHSSFTVEEICTFRQLGKPAAYYNEDCTSSEDNDCI